MRFWVTFVSHDACACLLVLAATRGLGAVAEELWFIAPTADFIYLIQAQVVRSVAVLTVAFALSTVCPRQDLPCMIYINPSLVIGHVGRRRIEALGGWCGRARTVAETRVRTHKRLIGKVPHPGQALN